MRLALFLLTFTLASPALAQSDPSQVPSIEGRELTEGPDGLRYVDLTEGQGPGAEAGTAVRIRVRIWSEDGEPIVIMKPSDDPLELPVGGGRMLPGLEIAMVGMKAGAARYVHLPQALAYGDTPPPGAPPGDLVAVIELVAMSGTSSPAGTRPRRPPEAPPTVDAFSDLPSGVQIADLVEGDGPKVAQGRLLHVDYTGWTDETHERFDSSYGRPEPFQLKLGTKQVIPGWEIALRDMRVGGRRLVRIPAYLAYGATAQGSIPAHADLLFEIHVVRME